MCNEEDYTGFEPVIRQNTRGANEFWFWRNKPVMEAGIAREVLAAAGVDVQQLRSRGDDPPDCEAIIEGLSWGIEVTELSDQQTLESTIRGEGQYFSETFCAELQRLIDRKDQPKVKGGPYDRYILVVATDETYLCRDEVENLLQGATFRAKFNTDAYLGLS
jgi:hypothetical protein